MEGQVARGGSLIAQAGQHDAGADISETKEEREHHQFFKPMEDSGRFNCWNFSCCCEVYCHNSMNQMFQKSVKLST